MTKSNNLANQVNLADTKTERLISGEFRFGCPASIQLDFDDIFIKKRLMKNIAVAGECAAELRLKG